MWTDADAAATLLTASPSGGDPPTTPPDRNQPVQVLTFDFHNTLANCDPWFHLEIRDLPWAVHERLGVNPAHDQAAFENAYRSLRLAVIESGNEIDATTSVVRIFDELGLDASKTDIEQAIDNLMREAIEDMEPVPGAAETVQRLHAAGIPLGVVSSAVHHETLEWILERMGIRQYFSRIVTSASSGYYKSTPAIYAAAMDQLGGTATRSVHVGDSLRWDVQTAQQAGLTAVWFETERHEVFNRQQPDVTPALTLGTMIGAAPALLELLATVDAR